MTTDVEPGDLLAQLAALGITPDRLDLLREQLERAEQQRSAPGPSGRGYGRVYVAANPLEHVGHALQQFRAGRRIKGLEAQHDEALQQSAAARREFMRRALESFGSQ